VNIYNIPRHETCVGMGCALSNCAIDTAGWFFLPLHLRRRITQYPLGCYPGCAL